MKKVWFYPLMVLIFLLLLSASSWGTEPSLWEIYNALYGEEYVGSNQELRDTYGVPYDEMWHVNNGYVIARARFAEYKQRFGYYSDGCVGTERVELFNVTDSGYLNPGEYESFVVSGGFCVIGFYAEPYSTGTEGLWFSQPHLNTDANDICGHF